MQTINNAKYGNQYERFNVRTSSVCYTDNGKTRKELVVANLRFFHIIFLE
jgi:hypothetical protein